LKGDYYTRILRKRKTK